MSRKDMIQVYNCIFAWNKYFLTFEVFW
jgi:hypothetical protein